MKRTPRLLLAVSLLGLSAVASSGSALADGYGAPFAPRFPWGFGYGSPPTYDGYLFSKGYPVYTGHDVTAIAVDLVNARFRHRRVVGPGVIYSQPNPYWW